MFPPREGDLTKEEATARATAYLRQGHTVHFKYTCAACGSRQTAAEPNVLHESYECSECRSTTTPTRFGFLLVMMTASPHARKGA